MDDLVAFVSARLDEDEAAAKAWLPPVRLDGSGSWYDEVGESNLGPYSIEHARLHDPARVLREVAAGRAILARYEDCLARMEDEAYPQAVARDQAREYEDFVLPNLAAAWSEHPDWRPEWKP